MSQIPASSVLFFGGFSDRLMFWQRGGEFPGFLVALCSVYWPITSYSLHKHFLFPERCHCLCSLLPLNVFFGVFFFYNLKLILSLLKAHSRLGLEKLVEILLGLGLTSQWLATLFLKTEAREGWKNRRESVWLKPQCAPSIPVVKWLILLVTMVTINTVAQPFVPGQFGSFFFPFFFWAKRFFTGKIEQQPSTEAWQWPFYINSLGITSKWPCHVF